MSDFLFNLTRVALGVFTVWAALFGGLPVLGGILTMVLAMFGVPIPEFVIEYLGHAYGLL
jgi:membrane protein YqaA with SNARE-associated domain